jgi:hypothetical protein
MRAAEDKHTENAAARKKANEDEYLRRADGIRQYKYGPRWENEFRGGKTRRTKKQSRRNRKTKKANKKQSRKN